jgi:hypothetical protein
MESRKGHGREPAATSLSVDQRCGTVRLGAVKVVATKAHLRPQRIEDIRRGEEI